MRHFADGRSTRRVQGAVDRRRRKYWRIFSIFPVGRAKDDPTLAVTDAQFREVLEFIKRTRKEGRID